MPSHDAAQHKLGSDTGAESGAGQVGRQSGAIIITCGNGLFGLCEEHLDMARGAHEGVDPTMGSEGTATATTRLIDLHVSDGQILRIDATQFGVTFGILEKAKNKLTRLLRPASHGHLMVTALRLSLNTDLVTTKRNNLLLLDDGLQVALCTVEGHALDRGTRLMRVLEMYSQVAAARLDGCEVLSQER